MAVQIHKSPGASVLPAVNKVNKYAQHLQAEPVKAVQVVGQTTTQHLKTGQVITEGTESEVIHEGMLAGPGSCKVIVSGSRTVNLGNYESVKISVGLEMPAPKDGLEDVYEFCTDWVGNKLTEAVKGAK